MKIPESTSNNKSDLGIGDYQLHLKTIGKEYKVWVFGYILKKSDIQSFITLQRTECFDKKLWPIVLNFDCFFGDSKNESKKDSFDFLKWTVTKFRVTLIKRGDVDKKLMKQIEKLGCGIQECGLIKSFDDIYCDSFLGEVEEVGIKPLIVDFGVREWDEEYHLNVVV